MLHQLTDGIFAADLSGEVNSYRQNLQIEYVHGLIAAMNKSEINHPVKATLYGRLKALAKQLSAKQADPDFVGLSGETQAHTAYLEFLLAKALAVKD